MNTKSIAELPRTTLISVAAGTVIVNQRVTAYPGYDGSIDGLFPYYAQIAEIHQWSNTVVKEVIFAIDKRFNVIRQGFTGDLPVEIVKEPVIKPHRGILYYGIGMMSITILLNIALIGADKHITWSLSTYFVLLGMTLLGFYGSAICFWSYFSQRK